MTDDLERRARAIAAEIEMLPVPGLPARITEACGSDLDLRAAVERHIIGTRALRDLNSSVPPQFEVVRVLAHNRHGDLLLARELTADRLVALKLVKTDTRSHRAIAARLTRVAETLARHPHPAIPRPLNCGASDARQVHVASEFVTGKSLRRHVEEQRVDRDRLGSWLMRVFGGRNGPAAAARLVVTIADALAHAHTHAVLHGDLTPRNVLIDERGRAFVTNFSLSVEPDPSPVAWSLILEEVRFAKEYASPEHTFARGSEQGRERWPHPSAQSDIYSLGVILYELLTLRLPPPASARVGLDARAEPARLPRVRRLNSRVPWALAAITEKALALHPDHRYASSAAMRDDLQRFLDGVPISIPRPLWIAIGDALRRGTNELRGAGGRVAAAAQATRRGAARLDSARPRRTWTLSILASAAIIAPLALASAWVAIAALGGFGLLAWAMARGAEQVADG